MTSPAEQASSRDRHHYESIKLKVGLEIHQQLATRSKLFCPCPSFSGTDSSTSSDGSSKELAERYPIQFTRILRAATSELGEIDLAAKFESRREILVRYFSNRETSCLVEADEEPPHPINQEAVETSLIFALALGSRVMDEIHVMRKIVVDGSNTAGFQRTAVVALGGLLKYDSDRKSVPVQSISVEEDAARAIKIEEEQVEQGTGAKSPKKRDAMMERAYALDRLGTPLVEVALAPIAGGTPEEVESAAASLGRLMRSSGRIARGLGTIRQDLNISVMDGSVIEVKGVQKLDQIAKVVEYEAARQEFFHSLADEIRARAGDTMQVSVEDATDLFKNTQSKIIKSALSQSYRNRCRVSCILARKLAGFIGKENEFHSRLGKELGSIARAYGLGGVFHSDELPAYGISEEEVRAVRARFQLADGDAFVLLVGSEEKVGVTSEALVERLRQCSIGVPPETRAATADGETVFLRPRPGAARMYPETDIPLIEVGNKKLEQLRKLVPEPWEKQVKEFGTKYDIPSQLAEPLFESERRAVFEEVVGSTKLSPGFVAYSLLDTLSTLAREGVDVDRIDNPRLRETLEALDRGRFAKEALPSLLKNLSENTDLSVEQAIATSGLTVMSDQELFNVVRLVIAENDALVKAKGIQAENTLMGKVMQKVRGKADGKKVNAAVSSELKSYLKSKETN